ncbi:MAG: 23S rRNA (pseudouridine(1915)-N(3))-methyltransferase RlmH [Clostridiales bacterium]|nr:23S rRNA (pseudouridine(1915)-N(3))-methyltransferase RlmH [Clostridiales bacterium]
MMQVTVLCVGKLKEDYLRRACAEYEKRLAPFCRLQITELAEARGKSVPNAAEIHAILEQEGARILQKCPADAYCAALCIEGELLSSEQFAQRVEQVGVQGKSKLVLIIGGSYGLSGAVKARADLRLSMSRMTFPHQLARVLVLEQLYRAFQINSNGKYHK